jgi:hypothetical protein
MVTSHVSFDEDWELTLEHFHAPWCKVWPQKVICPDWWLEQWAHAWPYDRSVRERYVALMGEDPLIRMTWDLSLQSGASCTTWIRLGPKGDAQLPG